MLFEIIGAILVGISAGVFTGLIPGVHVNLITAIVVSSTGVLAGINPIFVAIFILTLALTHSFLDSIPSIYLGAPDADQVVSVLPGHQLLLEGKGHHAITYTLIGSFFALVCTLLMFPYGLAFLERVQQVVEPFIAQALVVILVVILVLSRRFVLNALFLLLSGVLGLLCFDLVSQQHILLPLLSGLFGTSTLVLSLMGSSALPKQSISGNIPLKISDVERTVSRATIVGMFASFLPGFGSSQAAIVSSATMREKSARDYLLLVGGINTVNFAFSLVTLVILQKARNGAVLGMSTIVDTLTNTHILLFFPIILITGAVAVIIGLFLSKKMAVFMQKVDYHLVVVSVIAFLVCIVVLLSGLQGLLILVTATSLGVLASTLGAQKNMLLGTLLIPVIMYLW
ncbi:MAG: tripartite tricarboxylate transporter permease [Nanobdellota archaeon]